MRKTVSGLVQLLLGDKVARRFGQLPDFIRREKLQEIANGHEVEPGLADLPKVNRRSDIDHTLDNQSDAADCRLIALRHHFHEVDRAHVDSDARDEAHDEAHDNHGVETLGQHQDCVEDGTDAHSDGKKPLPAVDVGHPREPEQRSAPAQKEGRSDKTRLVHVSAQIEPELLTPVLERLTRVLIDFPVADPRISVAHVGPRANLVHLRLVVRCQRADQGRFLREKAQNVEEKAGRVNAKADRLVGEILKPAEAELLHYLVETLLRVELLANLECFGFSLFLRSRLCDLIFFFFNELVMLHY